MQNLSFLAGLEVAEKFVLVGGGGGGGGEVGRHAQHGLAPARLQVVSVTVIVREPIVKHRSG